ncbi:Hypothetical protein, putative [Bodo saltans]|uniref:Uncharacterized protein n=1 Tax=Bodo saltans TaxID=75058 RepID=A0A0S4JER3_BODSA|nr:Hypothetical protein, putative [Bodo saltans]|eukprot:CUG88940.1 Hypothetical protein, putative [Bodo saltans]
MFEEHVAFGSVLCLFVDAWMDLCAEQLHAWDEIMAANESDQRTAHGLARWRKKRLDAYYAAREADLAARHEKELQEANVEMAVAKARRRAREANGKPTTTDPLPHQSLVPEEDSLEGKQRKVLLAHMERRKLQETRREQALQQTSVERSNAMRQSPHDVSSSVEVESITSSLHHRRTLALHAHQARRRAQEERRGRQALQPPMDMRAVDAEHHQQVMNLLVASVKMNDDLTAEPHGLGGTTTPPPRRQHEGDVASPPGKLEPMFSPEEIQRRLDEAELEYERKGVTILSRREQERRIALRAEKLRSFHPAKPSY